MEYILEIFASFIIQTIETTGYAGIMVLMALESANIPIPSEIIMPFSGFLVWEGKLDFLWVVFWGAMGNLIGSVISYYVGFLGGRPFLEKYGKFLLVTKHDVDLADQWFQKYGTITIFASRVLPIVRTFISFPAGIARMNIWKFSVYTLTGSFIWSFVLAYAGVLTGQNWNALEGYFRTFDWLIAGILLVLGVWWICRHIQKIKNEK